MHWFYKWQYHFVGTFDLARSDRGTVVGNDSILHDEFGANDAAAKRRLLMPRTGQDKKVI